MGKAISDPPVVEINAETSLIKFTPVRLVALLAAAMLATNLVGNKISAMARTADVKAAVETHTTLVHPTTRGLLDDLAAVNATQDMALAKLESLPKQLDKVEAKLDAIILRELDQPGRGRDAMRSAARKVRSKARVNAGSKDDPLRSIGGL